MTRKQVPPGTRDARTGQYIRKPVRVQGSGEDGGKNGGCALTLLATAGAVLAVFARAKEWVA